MQRLDSLVPVYEQASREAAAARSEREAREKAARHTPTDTILVGPLHVVTLPDQVPLAREMFGQALERYEPPVGRSAALSRTLFTFQWSAIPRTIFVDGDPRRVEGPRFLTRQHMVRDAESAIGTTLAEDYRDTRLARGWYGGPVVAASDPAAIYRELAVRPARVNRACLEGDMTACTHALGLSLPGDSLSVWYTPDERRARALGLEWFTRNADMTRLRDACRLQMDVCDEILRTGMIPPPLSMQARASLLWFALELGGDGSWSRLLANADASPAQALSKVSGRDLEGLVRAWRTWVFDRRPKRTAGLATGTVSAVLWILLSAGLALRSTRWRLG